MSDGLGSATYSYNSLSRMTAEARNISQPTTPLSFTINYQYNLAGQLTSITDPNNKTINFTHDSVGRLSAITGPSFGGVTNYLSGLQYRAWGAVRHANYGNGKTSDATYNNRMKAAGFQIPDLI
jgi:YD repeat-containing protein